MILNFRTLHKFDRKSPSSYNSQKLERGYPLSQARKRLSTCPSFVSVQGTKIIVTLLFRSSNVLYYRVKYSKQTKYLFSYLSSAISMSKKLLPKEIYSLSRSKNFDCHNNNQRLIYMSNLLNMLRVLQKMQGIPEYCRPLDSKNCFSMCILNIYDSNMYRNNHIIMGRYYYYCLM